MTGKETKPDRNGEAAWLDDLLDDLAGQIVPPASPELMARVLADAEAAVPIRTAVADTDSIWRQLVQAVGGWTGVGGLVAAAATGFVIGFGALDTVTFAPIWDTDGAVYFEDAGSVDAFGWDYEEG